MLPTSVYFMNQMFEISWKFLNTIQNTRPTQHSHLCALPNLSDTAWKVQGSWFRQSWFKESKLSVCVFEGWPTCGSMAVLGGKVAHSAVIGMGPVMWPCRCLLHFHSDQTKERERRWPTHTHTVRERESTSSKGWSRALLSSWEIIQWTQPRSQWWRTEEVYMESHLNDSKISTFT